MKKTLKLMTMLLFVAAMGTMMSCKDDDNDEASSAEARAYAAAAVGTYDGYLVIAYTFNGVGPLRVKGTITPVGAKDQKFNVPLASGRGDGSLHFYSTGVDWRSAYLNNANNLQTKTVLGGTVFLMPGSDGSFGPVPAEPTENIIIESGNPTIFGNGIHLQAVDRV